MKNNSKCTMIAIFIALATTVLSAQEMRFQSAGEGEVFMIPEVSAVLRAEGEIVKVEMAMPVESRPAAYKDIDIKTGDIVLYLNGKRIKALKEFTSIYDSVKIGELVEIGLKRDDMRFISSFKKADPKDLPQRRTIVMRSDGGQVTTTDVGSDGKRMVMQPNEIEREMDELQPVMELGIILGGKKNLIQVARKLPIPVEGLGDTGFKEGDIFKSLNGKKLESLKQFTEMFTKLAVGDKVELEYEREKKMLSASFAKPQARGMMKIRRDQN